MNRPEFYEEDLLFFFDGKPRELALYEALMGKMEAAFPESSVRVQKSQIAFTGGISLPPCLCPEAGKASRSTASLSPWGCRISWNLPGRR